MKFMFSIYFTGTGPRSTIKIYAKCLKQNIEYKTLSISRNTTSAEVIWMLLSKFKMRHRDPKLFYLTMDIGVAALSRTLSLDEVCIDFIFQISISLKTFILGVLKFQNFEKNC